MILILYRFYKMTIILSFIIFFTSLCYSNFSYNGFLFPGSANHLISNDSDAELSKQLLFNLNSKPTISSSYILFPHSINTGIFDYNYYFKHYNILSSLYIINYGEFYDSESNYKFSSKDFIIKNRISKSINDVLHASVDIKYMHSFLDIYNSDVVATKISLYYYNQSLLVQGFIDNYGLVLSKYTEFEEELPLTYGYKMMYTPQYINALLIAKHDFYSNYSTIHFSGELFLLAHSSILLGFSSLAQDLYYGDFNNDFFTGISFGFSYEYKNYLINIGFKNLGAIGVSSAFSITKLIN